MTIWSGAGPGLACGPGAFGTDVCPRSLIRPLSRRAPHERRILVDRQQLLGSSGLSRRALRNLIVRSLQHTRGASSALRTTGIGAVA